ncbi:hypothetical protein E2C01_014767 [Portunus trituberculatus]|uniref:Uncharacterized protein n=1 Tax=Portunus trituberculatus TaxID=210409 RepID=A0A5B7DKW2_PORTR|nr:hypothetical protein [Portunus trituberculatus]
MAPKKLSSDRNKESGESASVSEPQHSIRGFTGITPEVTKDVFLDGDSSSRDLPPPPHPSPSPAFIYESYLQINVCNGIADLGINRGSFRGNGSTHLVSHFLKATRHNLCQPVQRKSLTVMAMIVSYKAAVKQLSREQLGDSLGWL